MRGSKTKLESSVTPSVTPYKPRASCKVRQHRARGEGRQPRKEIHVSIKVELGITVKDRGAYWKITALFPDDELDDDAMYERIESINEEMKKRFPHVIDNSRAGELVLDD